MKIAVLNKLSERRGSVFLHIAIITLIVMMLLAVSMEVARVYLTISMLKAKADSAVLAVASANAPNIHDGVRESDGLARTGSGDDWSSIVSTDQVCEVLISVLGLTEESGALVKQTSSGGAAYRITDLTTEYDNSDDDVLNFTTTLTIEIPLSFIGGGITITQSAEVKTSYDARF